MNLNPPSFSEFRHDGLSLAYFDEGDPSGEPVLLVHGFASSASVNWVFPGWLKTLGDAGYRVVALDNRGHGASSAAAIGSPSPTPSTMPMPSPPKTTERTRCGWASARKAVMRAPME